jgi:chromosome partitioning protein
LDLALEHVEDDYDYVLIDCPPFLGNLMDNALYAAQNTLIPALAETTSKRAFELLYDHIGALETDYGIQIQARGVIVNRIDVRKTQAREMIDWIEDAFDDTPVWTIRERASIQRALTNGVSLFEEDPDCDQIPVFRAIAERLDEQFKPMEAHA